MKRFPKYLFPNHLVSPCFHIQYGCGVLKHVYPTLESLFHFSCYGCDVTIGWKNSKLLGQLEASDKRQKYSEDSQGLGGFSNTHPVQGRKPQEIKMTNVEKAAMEQERTSWKF